MIFSTLKHLVHVLASSSNLLYVVCQHWNIEKVRSNSKFNELEKYYFSFTGYWTEGD